MRRSLFWLLDRGPGNQESAASLHRDLLEHAEEADRLGYASLWVAEHHFADLGTPNPAVLLAALAQRTTRIRLGPATAVLPLRHPLQTAEDYALVDVLSNGRLNLGVGCGSRPDEFTPFGVDFESRREETARSLAALRTAWRSPAVNVPPLQRPTPPIFVATTNEETAYGVGRAGDGLLTLLAPGETDLRPVAGRVDAHRRGLADSGRGDAEAIVMMLAHVADTEVEVESSVPAALGMFLSNLTGAPCEPNAGLVRAMRAGGTGLFGPPADVEARLEDLGAHGIDHIALIPRFGGLSAEAAVRTLRLLAPEPFSPSGQPT